MILFSRDIQLRGKVFLKAQSERNKLPKMADPRALSISLWESLPVRATSLVSQRAFAYGRKGMEDLSDRNGERLYNTRMPFKRPKRQFFRLSPIPLHRKTVLVQI
jgi:hypothetical protein